MMAPNGTDTDNGAVTLDTVPSEKLVGDEAGQVGGVGSGDAGAGVVKKVTTIADYISGLAVRATPEEVEAVQVFSRRLVEELN